MCESKLSLACAAFHLRAVPSAVLGAANPPTCLYNSTVMRVTECQRSDWKTGGHRRECNRLAAEAAGAGGAAEA